MTTNNIINAPLPFSLANGGSGAALTASNGGIIYSNASAMAVLAGTATANQALLSGASTTPAWSTATYPATTTINQMLYSSSANVIAGLATVNSAVMSTTSGGVPHMLSMAADGNVLIGSGSGAPTVGNITGSGGVVVTNGANTIALSLSGVSGFSYNNQASSSVTMAVNNGYIINNGASLVTATLPTTAAQGSVFEIVGFSSGGWTLAQAASQLIHFGNVTTTTGVSGSLSSTNAFDCVRIVCVVANTTFTVNYAVGNLTYV